MANDAASRREARRRRILENSEHRLQKITGRNDIISKGNVSSTCYMTLGSEEVSFSTQNGTLLQQTTNDPVQLACSAAEIKSDCCNSGYPSTGSYSENESVPKPRHCNKTSELSHEETSVYTPINLHRFYAVRLHLICLAVLVRILLTSDYGIMFGESMVAPLCVVEVTDILWLHLSKVQMKPSPGLLVAIMLLSGISGHKAAWISDCIQKLVKAVQDTCIYFFTFITFHVILEWSKNLQLNS